MIKVSRIIPMALAVWWCLNGVVEAADSSRFSPWQFVTGSTRSGRTYCGIMSAVSNKNIGQNVIIKGYKGADNLVIDLYKDKWNRPQGSKLNVTFDFLNNQPLTISAYADAHILDVELPQEHTSSFLLELTSSSAMQVILPSEDEATWVVPSSGSNTAIKKMISCLAS